MPTARKKAFRFSSAAAQGNERKYMEDVVIRVEEKDFLLFGVADGHGGAQAAEWVQLHIRDMAHDIFRQKGITVASIKSLFRQLHESIVKTGTLSGSTLSLLIVDRQHQPHRWWIANAGDSPIFGITATGVKLLSHTHNLEHKKEFDRVHKFMADHDGQFRIEDGYVTNNTNDHGLNMTRSLGDTSLAGIVKYEPYVHGLNDEELKDISTFIIVSDGFSDVVEKPQLSKEFHRVGRQTAHILNRWRMSAFPQHDNSTVVVVNFLADKKHN